MLEMNREGTGLERESEKDKKVADLPGMTGPARTAAHLEIEQGLESDGRPQV